MRSPEDPSSLGRLAASGVLGAVLWVLGCGSVQAAAVRAKAAPMPGNSINGHIANPLGAAAIESCCGLSPGRPRAARRESAGIIPSPTIAAPRVLENARTASLPLSAIAAPAALAPLPQAGPAKTLPEDFPPAGPQPVGLSRAQASWLKDILVRQDEPALTETGYQAFVAHKTAAMREALDWLHDTPDGASLTLFGVYASLRRVAESGLPDSERAALILKLNDRLAASAQALSRADVLSAEQRRAFGEIHDRYLANHAAVEELLQHRQAALLLSQLTEGARAAAPPSRRQTFTQERWTLQPPLPPEQRGQGAGEVDILRLNMAEISRDIMERRFSLEKSLARYRIVMGYPRFSRGLRERMAQELSRLLDRFSETAGNLYERMERSTRISLPDAFARALSRAAKPHRVIRVPDSRHLRLVPQPGGYLLKADFETDIRDRAVLRAVKSSIEEYWQGRFEWDGRGIDLRVAVHIRKLAPKQGFSKGSLRILATSEGSSYVRGDDIMLSHDLPYAAPAHEFGHILGLADEYGEFYDPEQRSVILTKVPSSLMGSGDGRVLPRHLKTAWWLLVRGQKSR